MKKALLGVALFLFAVACSNEEEFVKVQATETSANSNSNTRSLSEAIAIAQNAAKMFEGADTRSVGRSVDMSGIECIVKPSTRSAGGNDTLLYVVNYADDNGFAVISANKSTEGLLAVTEKGNYDAENNANEKNAGFNMFMNAAEDYVSTAVEIEPAFKTIKTYDTLSITRIEPKMSVKWGQSGYEGAFTPNGKAGCANTAMGQIMSYYEHPTQLSITYTDATINSLPLNWTELKKHRGGGLALCPATEESHEAIGQLMRQLGELNQSTYKDSGTGTSPFSTRNTFINLGYSVSTIWQYNSNDFYTELGNDKLLFMIGYFVDEDTNETSGHAWVVDGALQTSIHERWWTYDYLTSETTLLRDFGVIDNEYLHINWGWHGNCNGYFKAGVFATQNAHSYDSPFPANSNTADYNFNVNLGYFEVYR